MSRSLRVSLPIALLCIVLAAALQAQGRQGGGRGQVSCLTAPARTPSTPPAARVTAST